MSRTTSIYTCQICDRSFKSIRGLASHTKQTHNINKKDYYDLYLKNNSEGICCGCGKDTRFLSTSKGYYAHCSSKCAANNPNTQTKRIKTNNKKYGADHALQNKNIKKKSKETNLERYGYDNSSKSPEIKAKIHNIIIKKYGQHHSSLQVTKDKCACAKLEKYNDPTFNNRPKALITCQEKYGTNNPSKNDSIKKKIRASLNTLTLEEKEHILAKQMNTSYDNWGVFNPMHHPDVFNKSIKYTTKPYELPSGKMISLQGYEPQAMNILLQYFNEDEVLTNKSDVPTIKYYFNKRERSYYPDIWIPTINTLIEVKSDYYMNKYLIKM